MVPPDTSGQTRGQATRADILHVARRLFSEHGYHHTGIADLQEATGLTKGAFYHHFRSKEDLALAILDEAQRDYAEQLIGPAMARPTAAERIEALLEGAVALNARPEWCNCQMMATLCAELTSADGRVADAVRAMYATMHELWANLIAEAREAGEISLEIDPDTAAQWVTSTLTGALLARKLGAARVSIEDLLALVKQTLFSTT